MHFNTLSEAINAVANSYRAHVNALGKWNGAKCGAADLLNSFGGVMLGAGCFGAAVYLDILGKAVKLCAADDIWVQYALFCKRHPTAEFALEIEYLEVNDELGYALCVMPRYQTLEHCGDVAARAAAHISDRLKGYHSYGTATAAESSLGHLANNLFASWDLHGGNWAYDRGTRYNRLVLLDPWTGDGSSARAVEQIEYAERDLEGFKWFKKKVQAQNGIRLQPVSRVEAGPVVPPPSLRKGEARDDQPKRSEPKAPLFQVWAHGNALVAVGIKDGDRVPEIRYGDIKPWPGSPAEFNRAIAGLPQHRIVVAGQIRVVTDGPGKKSRTLFHEHVAYRVPNRELDRRLGWMGREALLGEQAGEAKSKVADKQGRGGADIHGWRDIFRLGDLYGGRRVELAGIPQRALPRMRFVGDIFDPGKIEPGRIIAHDHGRKADTAAMRDMVRPGQIGAHRDFADIEKRIAAEFREQWFKARLGPPLVERPEVLHGQRDKGDRQ